MEINVRGRDLAASFGGRANGDQKPERKGDGMVFIGPIEEAIRISNGERGEEWLLA